MYPVQVSVNLENLRYCPQISPENTFASSGVPTNAT